VEKEDPDEVRQSIEQPEGQQGKQVEKRVNDIVHRRKEKANKPDSPKKNRKSGIDFPGFFLPGCFRGLPRKTIFIQNRFSFRNFPKNEGILTVIPHVRIDGDFASVFIDGSFVHGINFL
jgi:hypothetical protein